MIGPEIKPRPRVICGEDQWSMVWRSTVTGKPVIERSRAHSASLQRRVMIERRVFATKLLLCIWTPLLLNNKCRPCMLWGRVSWTAVW